MGREPQGGTMPTPSGRSIAALSVLTLLAAACAAGAPATRSPSAPTSVAPPVATATPVASVAVPTQTPTPSPVAVPTAGSAPTGPPGPGTGGLLPTDPTLLGTGLVPEGWQVVEDATGMCRIAVPGDWTVGVAPGVGQTSVLAEGLAAVNANDQDWEPFKQSVDQFYLTGHVTLIDTGDVFLISNPIGPEFDVSYVLGLRFDDVNCQLLAT